MDKNVKDSKTRLREKKLRKQKMKKFLKSSLAILMALMLVGLALAPVFSQTYIVEDYRTDGRILVSDQNISLTVTSSTAEPDADR